MDDLTAARPAGTWSETKVAEFCPECTRLRGGEFVTAPCATRSDILAGLSEKELSGA